MVFRRIETAEHLPAAGKLTPGGRESQGLEFKVKADPRRMPEHAKDIAAMANAMGGAILVGINETDNGPVYPGLQDQTPQQVRQLYEQAAQMCSPCAVVDPVPIEVPTGVVVAVNVVAALDLVASPAPQDEHAWRFPMRTASQTRWLKPEEIPLYMNQRVRRNVLLLDAIPPRDLVTVYPGLRAESGGKVPPFKVASFAGYDLNLNVMKLSMAQGNARLTCHVPLPEVTSVWRDADERWAIKVAGRIMHVNGTLEYTPEYLGRLG